MATRLILLSLVLFVLPASALAATVKVRVEGQTQTLFAPTEAAVTAANVRGPNPAPPTSAGSINPSRPASPSD